MTNKIKQLTKIVALTGLLSLPIVALAHSHGPEVYGNHGNYLPPTPQEYAWQHYNSKSYYETKAKHPDLMAAQRYKHYKSTGVNPGAYAYYRHHQPQNSPYHINGY